MTIFCLSLRVHTWGKWEVVNRYTCIEQSATAGVAIGEPRSIGLGFYQERECSVCGKRQVRKAEAK